MSVVSTPGAPFGILSKPAIPSFFWSMENRRLEPTTRNLAGSQTLPEGFAIPVGPERAVT